LENSLGKGGFKNCVPQFFLKGACFFAQHQGRTQSESWGGRG
jgi:hypothetical protein